MKKLLVLLLSTTPLFLGYLLSYFMLNYNLYGFKVDIIGLAVLLAWCFFGALAGYWIKDLRKSILLGNACGIVCAVLYAGQYVVFGKLAGGVISQIPQMFFLPIIGILARIDIFNFMRNLSRFVYVGMAIMLVIYYFGYNIAIENS